MAPSSRGLGHLPFTEATGVRIPLGLLKNWTKLSSNAIKKAPLWGAFFMAQDGEGLVRQSRRRFASIITACRLLERSSRSRSSIKAIGIPIQP